MNASIFASLPLISIITLLLWMSTTRPRNDSQSWNNSDRFSALHVVFKSIRSRSTKFSELMSSTRTIVMILSSCLRTWSRTLSSPWTTKVIREMSLCSVSPTARLSMLKPREASIPETWASTPG